MDPLSAPSKLASGWRYEPERRAGRGVTSEVWLAHDSASGARVALKVARSSAEASLLADEAEALMVAASPRIPAIVDAGRIPRGVPGLAEDAAYLAMAWIDGISLDPAAPRAQAERYALALSVARDVGEALSHLHDGGVAHGDLKPANVIVQQRDGAWDVTLIDLGFSMDAVAEGIRGATPRYLPPEAASGRAVPWARDVFGLGLILAELVDERVAHSADPTTASREVRLPPPFDAWCRALAAPEPSARPSAGWIASCAREAMGAPPVGVEASLRRLRASYLRLRREELRKAGRARAVNVREGVVSWVTDAVPISRTASLLRGEPERAEAREIAPLGPGDRLRWLVALVGPAAADWVLEPAVRDLSEAQFAGALERLAARVEPAAWSQGDLTNLLAGGAEPPARETWGDGSDDVGLALALSQRPTSMRAIETAERRIREGTLPARLVFLLAQSLALRGEPARALAWVARMQQPEAIALTAELQRRSGERGAARSTAEAIARGRGAASDRALAVLGRILVDEERPRDALALLEGAEGGSAAEARALARLALGQREEALRAVGDGLATTYDEETRARLECVRGMEAHARGEALDAHAAFSRAADHATRAGAVVEEATYRTGVAAAAVDAGLVSRALEASSRASLVWEHLQRPTQLAYALLARASAFAMVGERLNARREGERARDCARQARDERAEAFAWMLLADVAPDDSDELRGAASEAWRTLGRRALADDELRAGARMLRAGGLSDEKVREYDASARGSGRSNTACCDWWGSRATASLGGRAVGRDAEIVSNALRIVRVAAPVGAKGPALHAARLLAIRLGDGEAVRVLMGAQAQLAARLRDNVPDQLREHLSAVPWLTALEGWEERGVSIQQARNLETLIRSLATRDGLRGLLTQVLDALVLWTGVERGLLLLTAPGGQLVVKAARNLARHDLQGEQLALSQSLARRALETREPVVAVDAAGEIAETHASVHALGLRSVLAVPLLARGEALGVAYLDDRIRKGAFGPDELGWVRLLGSIAAVAIADARDQLLLKREARRARRAEARLAQALAEREAELDRTSQELARTKLGTTHRYRYDAIVGRSAPMVAMLDLIDRVTPTAVPVLIQGESGSGKELVARALHENGPRAKGPFVTENCSAIPESLLESTLFGHVRGAFTGADRTRIGLFEAADGGTLFLDEIGEMPLAMQTRLLRVLQDGEVHPLGSSRSRKVDVRVIAATNRDLTAAVRDGAFREDLWFRLNVLSIVVPPLRERAEDIPLLVAHLLRMHAQGRPVRVSSDAMSKLAAFPWPGNVRQLENEVRRALVLSDDAIRSEHLTAEVRGHGKDGNARATGLNVRSRVDALERELVREALERTRGNQTKAALMLGLSRYGLQKMMKRLDVRDS